MDENPFSITDDDKAAFAEELLRTPGDTFAAAQRVFGTGKWQVNKCLWAATYLPKDERVLFFKDKGKEAGITEELPTVYDAAKRAWELANNIDPEVSVKALKLFVEIRQFKESAEKSQSEEDKPPGIMEIPCYGTDENWQENLKKHQAAQIEKVSAVH